MGALRYTSKTLNIFFLTNKNNIIYFMMISLRFKYLSLLCYTKRWLCYLSKLVVVILNPKSRMLKKYRLVYLMFC